MKKDVIFIVCAHSDDEAVGMGGTIFKYLDENKQIIKIIFSFGEKSLPHIKDEHTKKTRVDETIKIEKRLGMKTYFIGVKDSQIMKEVDNKKLKIKLLNLIKRFKPSKVFIPSFGDFHLTKDHQAVAMITTDVLKKMDYNGEIYTYELWLLKKENLPYIYV
ncbi:MAG: PIG-L family deacetylase, partial [Candidatus Nanoarchaeia archaeon]|nr:PIG-L family deacetylase [Candidatus Nanoarchaeia archaeon]